MNTLIGAIVAAAMAILCVVVHSEVVVLLERFGRRIRTARMTLIFNWSGLLLAHVAEVWLYALAYWQCAQFGIGGVVDMSGNPQSLIDYAYFSAAVYTSLGFGDLLPESGVRLLAGSEALVGLCLIAWSATATYAVMTRRLARSKTT